MSEKKRKPCPCGNTPDSLSIYEGISSKWAWVYGDCCGEWSLEFRTGYNPIDSQECRELAEEAWNDAPRKEENA